MKAEVRTSPDADDMIREAVSWWRANRPAAPDLLSDEVASAFQLLEGEPDAGKLWKTGRVPGVRRILLRETRYHVYYVHAETRGIVFVIALWSAVRGKGPKLVGP